MIFSLVDHGYIPEWVYCHCTMPLAPPEMDNSSHDSLWCCASLQWGSLAASMLGIVICGVTTPSADSLEPWSGWVRGCFLICVCILKIRCGMCEHGEHRIIPPEFPYVTMLCSGGGRVTCQGLNRHIDNTHNWRLSQFRPVIYKLLDHLIHLSWHRKVEDCFVPLTVLDHLENSYLSREFDPFVEELSEQLCEH